MFPECFLIVGPIDRLYTWDYIYIQASKIYYICHTDLVYEHTNASISIFAVYRPIPGEILPEEIIPGVIFGRNPRVHKYAG
jgi:hypothetical protein